jgi:hypothetical protein
MITKIALIAAAAAILFGTTSTTFAAPKNRDAASAPRSDAAFASTKNQRLPEPLYFTHATGETN